MLPRKKSYAIILSLIGLLWGCGDKSDPGAAKDKLVKVPVAVATITQQPFLYEAVGSVQAQTTSILSSKLMGTVNAVYVHEGNMVKKGDLLVSLDAREVAAQFRKAKAALAEAKKAEASAKSAKEAAKAGAELAGSTYNRYLKLMEEDSASKQEFEEVKARHRQAEASFSQAEAMVQAARYRVQQGEAVVASARVSEKDASVLAPYDGKISAKMIDEGDLAAPGTPLLILERRRPLLCGQPSFF
ncbi:efflux RND transporter periplasmic adaptor subunit [Thermodesulfobacteriota bacterium]